MGAALYLGNGMPSDTDEITYSTLGMRLLSGHGYSFPQGWYPFILPDTPTAFWSFLEPVFVAGVYALFGTQPLWARLAHAVVGGIVITWMSYRLALRLFGSACPTLLGSSAASAPQTGDGEGYSAQRAALFAAFLSAIYLYLVVYSAMIMTETLYIAALLWSLERAMAVVGMLSGEETGNGKRLVLTAVGLGLALGLATLARQSILPWVAVMFAFLLWVGLRNGQMRQASVVVFAAGGILALCILPATIRNYRVFDGFLLLNSNTGYAMFSAQHPLHGTSFQEYAAAPLPDDLYGLSELYLDKELMRRGLGFIAAEPGRYVLLSLSRVRDYIEFWPTADSSTVYDLGRLLSFGLFLPFMIYGLYLSARRCMCSANNGRPQVVLLYLFMGFYSIVHILTWAMPRYRLPVEAVLLPFAAAALLDIAARLPFRGLHVREPAV
jgi:hypothetical protein